MKEITTLIKFLFSFWVVLLALSCIKEPPKTVPELTATEISNVTSESLTASGNVESDGGAEVTSRGICWNTMPGPTTMNEKVIVGNGVGTFSTSISGLTPGTIYYFRSFAINLIGTGYGYSIEVKIPARLPVLTTAQLSSITETTAICGGNITSDGGASIIARGVCWDINQNPTIASALSFTDESIFTPLNAKTSDGTGKGSFISNITGLNPGVTYYFRAYATNSAGTSYGNQVFGTTLTSLPTLLTSSISNITATSVKSGGNITNDGGLPILEKGVCWSTSQIPTINNNKKNIISGSQNYAITIADLLPGTTYCVRAYAINSLGVGYGNQLSFTTLATLPTLTTNSISSIKSTTAISGGNISSDGGSNVTARGICWSTSVNPTTNNNKTIDGSGTGVYSSNLSGLAINTSYNVRAYATNSIGTSYGNNLSFTTTNHEIIFNPNLNYGMISDIEGNEYKTIVIGIQNWMAENLRTTKFSDGSFIQNITDNSTWSNISYPAFCWYNNNVLNKYTYGALYNWYCINSNKLCPDGWHTPNDDEWNILVNCLGGSSSADYKLKEIGNTHWKNSNTGWGFSGKEATNESGFTALPGGIRFMSDPFDGINDYGIWWSIVKNTQNTSWFRIGSTGYYVSRNYFLKNNGYSVRCVETSVPTLTTNNISIVMFKNAYTGGNITHDGGAQIIERGVCWNTKQNPTISDYKISNSSSFDYYSCTIPDLLPGVTYYVRAYATNKKGTGYGNQLSFETDPVPKLTTSNASNITSTSATCGGTIIDNGGTQILSRGICWSLNENPTTADKTAVTFSTSSNFVCDLTNLISGTKYYIRAFATSLIGTGYGNQVTLTTLADVPVISTKEIINITSSTAVGGGNISHDGGASVILRGVCWSTDRNPSIDDNKSSDGSGTGDFSSSISGLLPGTEYYVRAFATNSVGTGYGKEERFSTLRTVPVLTTKKVSDVTSTTAVSGGELLSDGGSFIYERGICWSTSPNPLISDKKSIDWGSSKVFNCNLTGLTADTKYYVRAYATNLLGTGYGNQESFKSDFTPTVSTPVMSPTGGTYSTAQTVTISCNTSGAEIRYTKDGSEPTKSSILYISPISVNSSMTIKAKAFKNSWVESSVASQTYIINSGGSLIIGSSDKIQHISASGDFVFRLNNLVNKDVYFIFSNTNTKNSRSLPDITRNIILTEYPTNQIGSEKMQVEFGIPEISKFNIKPPRYSTSHESNLLDKRLLITKSNSYNLGYSEYFTDYDGNKYLSTIRKVISAHGKNLYLWVANDCWGSSSKKPYFVTQSMIDIYASKFLNSGINDDIYEWVTNICGQPWGETNKNYLIPDSDDIHVWFFDIPTVEYAGYFSGVNNYLKAYKPNSNEKIMFAIDAVIFAEPDGVTWEITDENPMFMVSALAHEFVHMIYFFQKNIKQNLDDENNVITEMAALSVEDIVANKILANGPRGVPYGIANAGNAENEGGRLPLYNKNNNISLLSWPNNDGIHYSKTYAFGAYLMRNYGGANFVKQVVQNQYIGADCIVNAVNSNGGGNLTFENIIKNFGAANLLSDNTNLSQGYRFNTGNWFTSNVGGVSYQLGSINLFNYNPDPYIYSLLPTTQNAGSNLYYLAGKNLTGTKDWSINGLNSDIKLTVIIK